MNAWTFAPQTQNPLYGPPPSILLLCGGKSYNEIVHKHEQWRLVTAMFLHGGVIHLIMNTIGLVQLGFAIEGQFGPWRIAALYLISGIFGNMISCIFLPNEISVGASGALFGLIGY